MFLTLSQTSPGFYVSAVHVCRKYKEKISPFPTVFSTHLENFVQLSSILKLLQTLSLEESKIYRLEKG